MPKQQQNIAVGVDVGTTKVTVCVGTIQEGIVNIVGIGTAPNSGVRRGMVTDIEETVSAISSALEEAERMSGLPITEAYVGVGGHHITSTNSKGVIAVSRADGEISETDVERVIEAARAVALPPNHEILHVIPRTYTIDGQQGVKDPVGMNGIRLEVETHVIGASSSALKNLCKCVEQSGLGIEQLVFSPLATTQAILSKKQKEAGVALVDIGAGTTGIAIYEDGDLLHTNVLNIGSLHVTHDIAIGLRTTLDIAEKLKVKYATAQPDKIRDNETINLATFDPNEDQKVSRKYVAEIVEARLNEIFSMVRNELKLVGKDGMLPAGVVFTGGGSQMQGMLEASKETLRLPAQIGYPLMEISGMIDKLDNPMYATGIGLMLWGINESSQSGRYKLDMGKMGGVFDKVKGIFRQFSA